MENKSWEESVADEVREEMSHSGDFYFSLPSPADAFKKTIDEQIDELEAVMQKHDQVVCELKHRFVKGLYIRKIYMPVLLDKKMTLVTSLIHVTNHPYFILRGKVLVFSDNDGGQFLQAGDWGITRPATRRVLRIWEDCVWVTCHPIAWITGEEDSYSDEEKEKVVDRIRAEIIEPHVNTYLGGILINNVLTKTIDK